MSAWTTGTVQTNGITLHYQRTGGAKPPLVLCHGFSDCHVAWTRTAQALADAFDLTWSMRAATAIRTNRQAATAPPIMPPILPG